MWPCGVEERLERETGSGQPCGDRLWVGGSHGLGGVLPCISVKESHVGVPHCCELDDRIAGGLMCICHPRKGK